MSEVVAEIKDASTSENEIKSPSPLILEGVGCIEHRDLQPGHVQPRAMSNRASGLITALTYHK